MATFSFTTAGESHGPGLVTIVEGLPAGLELSPEDLDGDLARRQLGHGRGGRMKIESDRAEVTSGIRHGRTLGSPVALPILVGLYTGFMDKFDTELIILILVGVGITVLGIVLGRALVYATEGRQRTA